MMWNKRKKLTSNKSKAWKICEKLKTFVTSVETQKHWRFQSAKLENDVNKLFAFVLVNSDRRSIATLFDCTYSEQFVFDVTCRSGWKLNKLFVVFHGEKECDTKRNAVIHEERKSVNDVHISNENFASVDEKCDRSIEIEPSRINR